jgi:hypothetical protein
MQLNLNGFYGFSTRVAPMVYPAQEMDMATYTGNLITNVIYIFALMLK